MAEHAKKEGKHDKKEKKHDEDHEGGGMKEATEKLIVVIIILVFLAMVWSRFSGGEGGGLIFKFFGSIKNLFAGDAKGAGEGLLRLLFWVKFIGTYLSLIFGIFLIYTLFALRSVNKKDHELYSSHHGHGESHEPTVHPLKEKWERILLHVNSNNPSDWRLSILEADILLEEVMEKKGFLGETLGEKLQNADKNAFATLPQAWEAHRVRNQIAHVGADFPLSQREARQVIELFKEVFDEFHI